MHAPVAIIDFESRSTCNLDDCGSWKYSQDVTTEVLCLVIRLPHWAEGETLLWHPEHVGMGLAEFCDDWGLLVEFFEWVDAGGLVEGHNSFFERGVTTNIMTPRYGWPAIPHKQWRCSAAKAAALALPRALEKAVKALNLPLDKDMEGSAVMMKMTKPRKPRKLEVETWANQHGCGVCVACKGKGSKRKVECAACGGMGFFDGDHATIPPLPVLWHETRDMFERVCDYCRVDVLAEEQLSLAIPDLTEEETEIYLLDQAMNERGFGLDREAVEAAGVLIEDSRKDLNAELALLTGGAVTKSSQRERMKDWLAEQGCDLDDMRGETVDAALEGHALTPSAKRGLEIYRTLGRSSTAKYEAMEDNACPDWRVRGGLLYHGASTGRWTGKGIQPQNFPRGTLKNWDMSEAWELLKTLDVAAIVAKYGDVMEALAQALRGALVPTKGRKFFVADYAGIEARVLLWLAGEDLSVFAPGLDIYCEMATTIYGHPITKKEHPKERQLGKAAILGCGYQMGGKRFVESALALGGVVVPYDSICIHEEGGIECGEFASAHDRDSGHRPVVADPDEKTSVKTVAAYRVRFPLVVTMWRDQQDAAILATRTPGEPVVCGRVEWVRDGRFLFCTLPSGRRLAYADPEVHLKATPWGEKRPSLSFMGVHPKNKQWLRQTTYGGSLTENIVQAVARDLMAHAMQMLEASGVYVPTLTIHDEIVSEAVMGAGSVEEYVALITDLPEWSEGCPITAEGFSADRYHKE